MIFYGMFNHNLDEKSRITIPMKFRDALGNKVFLTRGFGKCLYLYNEETYAKIAAKYSEYDDLLPYERQNSGVFFASSMDYDVDKAGRITLNKFHMKMANIEKEVILVGRNDHFELWNPDEFIAYNEESTNNFESNAVIISENRKKVSNV